MWFMQIVIYDVVSGFSKFFWVPPSMAARLCEALHIREQRMLRKGADEKFHGVGFVGRA